MTIRSYSQYDLPAIFDIYNRSKLDELNCEDEVFTLLPLKDDAARLGALMESEIYVYHEHNCISGYGAIFGNEIRALFVHPKYRGKGIGKQLLEFLLSLIHEQPSLYVASSNQLAKKLYQLYGFSVIETFKTSYNHKPVIAQKMVRV